MIIPSSIRHLLRPLAAATLLTCLAAASVSADEPKPLRLLFLGDNGHHRPAERFAQLQPVLAERGILLDYSDKVESLDPRALAPYAGLVIYANTTEISPDQERALLEFVESGHALVALHCASFCFLNSPKYIDLVGAQFLRHGTGTFRTTIVAPDHPIMRDFDGLSSWDETYVHTKHNEKDRTVLEVRAEGDAQRAVDLGAHAGQGPRLLYRLGTRRAHLGQTRLSEPRRARHPLGHARRSGQGWAISRRCGLPAAADDAQAHRRRAVRVRRRRQQDSQLRAGQEMGHARGTGEPDAKAARRRPNR